MPDVTPYPDPILRLMDSLTCLPGIGRKTAERLALHILHTPEVYAQTLCRDIIRMKKTVCICDTCFALSDSVTCRICSDPSRNQDTICVVENPADMAAIEKSGAYRGVYHVLGGVLSPIDGIGPEDIRMKELFCRSDPRTVREIIVATNTSVEGESTASYIMDHLRSRHIPMSRIATGVPMGGDLQFVDPLTLLTAMERRHAFQ
jgi:recombination protein RecR